MSPDNLQEGIDKLRTVELRRAVRGVDPEHVRKLLDEAAGLLAAAGREQDDLRRELERLQAANDEESIAKALLTATRAGEALVAEAQERAASLTAEAEAQASALLEQVAAQARQREQETAAARAEFERELAVAKTALDEEHKSARVEAEAALAGARGELTRLESRGAQLRSLVSDLERRIVEIAEGALSELEALDPSPRTGPGADMLVDLQPAGTPSDVAAPRPAPAARSEDRPQRR